MGAWKVSTRDSSVEVEAPNWLMALGMAVTELGLGSGALGRLVCTVNVDGTASALDPSSGIRFEVGPVDVDAPPPLLAMPGSSFASQLASVVIPPSARQVAPVMPPALADPSTLSPESAPTAPPLAASRPPPPPPVTTLTPAAAPPRATAPPVSLDVVPPPLAASSSGAPPRPVYSDAETEPPPIELHDDDLIDLFEPDTDDIPRPSGGPADAADRMFVVFDRCGDISAARDTRTACRTALTLLGDLVTADAGAVLVRSRSGNALSFTAAFGPRASRVIDTSIPVDQGIAGFVHGFGLPLVVDDVRQEPRFLRAVDKQSGYRTRSVLAVPVTSSNGASLGCMELLNAPAGFADEDIELAKIVAGSLGSWLEQALG